MDITNIFCQFLGVNCRENDPLWFAVFEPIGIRLNCLGYLFKTNCHPLNDSGHPFENSCHPFERMGYPFEKSCHPFERLGISV